MPEPLSAADTTADQPVADAGGGTARLSPTISSAHSIDFDNLTIPAEELALLVDAWQALNKDFYGEKPEAREQIYGSIRGLLQSYNDPYTFFIVPETNEVEEGNLRGSFGGIGAEIVLSEEGYVLTPLRDSPAEEAGVEPGDILVKVDEVPVTTQTSSDEVISLIRGPLDTEVKLGLLRHHPTDTEFEDVEALTITVTRSEIQTPSMDWRLLSSEDIPEERLVEAGAEAENVGRIGYIQHRIYSDRSPAEMERAITELLEEGADRFIIDLRGNPGGPVNAVIAISDMWIDTGTLMLEEKADGVEKRFEATEGSLVADEPVVILLDGGSASASEIFAGALRDHNKAVLLGERTFGKGSVQIIHVLPDTSSMHITNALWFTPEGFKIDGEGLIPDVPLEAGTDFLQEAILYILVQADEHLAARK